MSGRLRWLLTLPVLAAACGGGSGSDPATARNLLLVTVDTLRADHVGAYGHRNATTPRLDALAARGVRFEDATVQWPLTWPSLASILTGRYPAETGVRSFPLVPLADENETLAEILAGRGFRTGAVVSNIHVGRRFGFDQGFETFVETYVEESVRQTKFGNAVAPDAAEHVKRYLHAGLVTENGIAWLEHQSEETPFFLWLHYMDPHTPYDPPEDYAGLFEGRFPPQPVDPRRIPPTAVLGSAETGGALADLAHYKSLYDAEIRYFDDQLAKLLETIEARGFDENTLIVVTADHGESLDEHGEYLHHGTSPYQPTVRVPLVLAGPTLPGGRTVAAPVALIDLAPTILELLDLPPGESFRGRSLAPLVWADLDAEPRDIFFEAGTREPSHLGIRRGPWKLIRLRERREGRIEEATRLFDLRSDPDELRDVSGEQADVARDLGAALDAWIATLPAAGDESPALELDDATREMIRALGYAQ